MPEPELLDDIAPVQDCDCVLSYPSVAIGYQTLVSVDENGVRYERLETPINRVKDAMADLLSRMRNRPCPPPQLRRLK